MLIIHQRVKKSSKMGRNVKNTEIVKIQEIQQLYNFHTAPDGRYYQYLQTRTHIIYPILEINIKHYEKTL